MKGFSAVYKKELYVFMASPIFFVMAFIFLGLMGYFFYTSVAFYNLMSYQAAQNPYMAPEMNMTSMVVRPFFGDMAIVMLFIFPLLTMRLFSEEKKSGTIELLFTLPIKEQALALAKYVASLTVFGIMLLGTIPFLLLMNVFGTPDWGVIMSGYLGVFLLGSAFIALGMFVSSLTENQIVAACVAFGALLMFWLIGWVKSYIGGAGGEVMEYLGILGHLDNLLKGLIDSRDVLYYVLFTLFFVFCTLRTLDSKKWRS
ncbi:MAG: ABC transporter permease subunit [Deltaproteobacteria bacterium]|nr:ABC transporter permease subunit [Deltaproteobacteria bacterium]